METQMDSEFLGQDLDLGFVLNEDGWVGFGPHSPLDLTPYRRTDVSPRTWDMQTTEGLRNLIQSLILRLQTERGEAAPLGHPDYGSRHHELVGEPNTETNRNRIKLYVLECLRHEPRLERIDSIDVSLPPGKQNRDQVNIVIQATVRGESVPFNLVVPFSFAGPLS